MDIANLLLYFYKILTLNCIAKSVNKLLSYVMNNDHQLTMHVTQQVHNFTWYYCILLYASFNIIAQTPVNVMPDTGYYHSCNIIVRVVDGAYFYI